MKIHKATALFLSVLLLVQSVVPVFAFEAPTPPAAPTPPSQQLSNNNVPSTPSTPTPPALPSTPVSTPTPIATPKPASTPKPSSSPHASPVATSAPVETTSPSSPTPNATSTSYTPAPSITQSGTGGQNSDGGSGSSVATGDATTTGISTTSANSNLATGGGSAGGIGIVNSGNGTNSTNNGSISVVDTSVTNQDNDAVVGNNMGLITVTGDNSTSRNTGGENSVVSGDANTTGTMLTAVNTNVSGVSVSEFNIADTHRGDYVLDFNANCISGCGGANGNILNTGNGAGSQNSGEVTTVNNDLTFQNNDATVENNMNLLADSGHNDANRNTGGDSTIKTGDANVAASAVTFANNNIAGNVYYGVVNIFGDLVGDIVLPESVLASLVGNTGNGADSTNTTNSTTTNNSTTEQTNTAVIDNNLILAANTGDNEVSRNTDGSNAITTGNTEINASVLNVVNSNIEGGNMWLVLVNEAGKWIGRILGGAEGANVGASAGTEFLVGENGEITAVNAGNGAGSTNTASSTTTNNQSVVQQNTAHVVNNINLNANTGKNDASRNTGGSSNIETGDATVIVNIVNFVNNNITGGGKLFVTVVNVFGSWIGDFRGPGFEGTHNQPTADNGRGGQSNSNVSHSNSGSTSNQSTENASVDITPTGSSKVVSSASRGAFAINNIAKPTQEDAQEDSTGQVLGTSDTSAVTNDGVTINLAWLIPLFGIFVVGLIINKIYRARIT